MSKYSSNRKSNVNDDGHEEFDTANGDILCMTWPVIYCTSEVTILIAMNAFTLYVETTSDKLPVDFIENALLDLRAGV
jgi:hypothetical protein